MKTLKQLQVEHVSDMLLNEMRKEITVLEIRCEEITNGLIPFCYARKSIKMGIERYCIILNRFNRLISKYPVRDGYDYDDCLID